MNISSKRIGPRLYQVRYNGKSFEIDGQIHEHDTGEWQLFNITDGPASDLNWIETYPTKKAAMAEILNH